MRKKTTKAQCPLCGQPVTHRTATQKEAGFESQKTVSIDGQDDRPSVVLGPSDPDAWLRFGSGS